MAITVTVTWVRTSCVLLRIGAVHVLTDPWFAVGMRGLPVFRKPSILLKDLPKIDYILASHLHPDHFDVDAVRELTERGAVVVGTVGTAARLHRHSVLAEVVELLPWQTWSHGGLRVVATPALHTGPKPDEIGIWFELSGFRCYFAGDQRIGPVFAQVGARLPRVDLALLPIGGTLIFGHRTTMDPADAVRAALVLRPRYILPIHEGGEWLPVPPASWHPGRCRDFLAKLATSGLDAVGLDAPPGIAATIPFEHPDHGAAGEARCPTG